MCRVGEKHQNDYKESRTGKEGRRKAQQRGRKIKRTAEKTARLGERATRDR